MGVSGMGGGGLGRIGGGGQGSLEVGELICGSRSIIAMLIH